MSVMPWVKEQLQSAGVPFSEISHPPTYTAQGLAEKEHVSGHQVLKVVLIIADGKPIQLVLPASRLVSFHRLDELLGGKIARLATEREMAEYMKDCQIGAAPPLRHWGFDLWMDPSVRSWENLLFQGGTHQDSIRMGFDDWFRMARPRVERFCQ